jgi:coproporphyrinogen III oxidase
VELKARVRRYFGELQDTITRGLTELDPAADLREDRWQHSPGEGTGAGGGITRILGEGAVFEKGGVNLSEVSGELGSRLAGRLEVEPQAFYATGVSLVLHPSSPMVPTVHMNVRYLELSGGGGAWFGGGADLTPYYLFDEDAVHFHRAWKEVCDRHDVADHTRFKKACDDYFRIPHRNEGRGVGGVFFDYLKDDLESVFGLVRDVGDAFLEAYAPIVRRRVDEPWGEPEKRWQLVRRGRYVEFNLVYDRGTLFGLETGGRIESILMSLPPAVRWVYDHRPEEGSPEARLVEVLRRPRDWV